MSGVVYKISTDLFLNMVFDCYFLIFDVLVRLVRKT